MKGNSVEQVHGFAVNIRTSRESRENRENRETLAHPGGSEATRRLARCCILQPGDLVLNLGCGDGTTAVLLAQEYGVRVVAVDSSEAAVRRTRERSIAAGVAMQVSVVQGNSHALDFRAATFDAVIAEATLAAGDRTHAAAEMYRVLKPGKFFGANELTFLACPPPATEPALLTTAAPGSAAQPQLGAEWLRLFEQAGFSDVSAALLPLNAHTYPRYLGYGLYLGRKPRVQRALWARRSVEAMLQFVN